MALPLPNNTVVRIPYQARDRTSSIWEPLPVTACLQNIQVRKMLMA